MKRFASLLVLMALALPYGRTPICASSGHEHEGHHGDMAGITAPDGHAGTAAECHELMACDTSVQGTPAIRFSVVESRDRLIPRADRLSTEYQGPTRAPTPPPPQSV